LANDGTNRFIIMNDSTNSNRLTFRYRENNFMSMEVHIGGVLKFGLVVNSADITLMQKIALKYKESDYAFWINGVEVGTNTLAEIWSANTLNNIDFDGFGQPFFGKTKALAVFPYLSDAELADLTYPTPTDPTFSLDFDTIATDFTFARGSEATYVDAQGLIKSTNEIGPELVTNGDFSDGSTGWTLGVGHTVSGSKLNINGASFTYQPVQQTVSSRYRLSFSVSNYVSGTIRVYTGSGTSSVRIDASSDGNFELDYIANGNTVYVQPTGGIFIGSIDNVSIKEVITATNTPRLDYSTGAEAFLLEPQSTNLLTYSEDFSNASWTAVNTTITSDYGISPDGTNNSTRLVFGSGTAYVNRSEAIGVGDQASSIYVKGISGQILKFGKGANVGSGTNFTLNGDWQRLEQISTNSGTAYHISSNIGGANATEVEVWGAMLENQSYATSYIPTAGTSVTRNQETCINATPEINSEEGVLYAEIAALSNDLTNRIISITNGASVNGVSLYYSSSSNVIRANYYVGGVAQCNLEYILADETDFSKIAFVWKINRFELWVDSIKRAEDLSGAVNVANTMNDLSFRRLGSNIFFGNTKDLQVYTKALSDAELIKLTT